MANFFLFGGQNGTLGIDGIWMFDSHSVSAISTNCNITSLSPTGIKVSQVAPFLSKVLCPESGPTAEQSADRLTAKKI
jgi:hypothetical protein